MVASGTTSVRICNALEMVTVQVRVAKRAAASLTLSVKLNAPDRMGVPEIAPVEEVNESPGGSCPDVTDHEYGGAPPVAVSGAA